MTRQSNYISIASHYIYLYDMRVSFARLKVLDGVVYDIDIFDRETPNTFFLDNGIYIYNNDYPIIDKGINIYRDISIIEMKNILKNSTSKFIVSSEKLKTIL